MATLASAMPKACEDVSRAGTGQTLEQIECQAVNVVKRFPSKERAPLGLEYLAFVSCDGNTTRRVAGVQHVSARWGKITTLDFGKHHPWLNARSRMLHWFSSDRSCATSIDGTLEAIA